MSDAGLLAVKALNGGLFVAAFAVVAELLVPKRFAGLFSASPAVALANLTVIVVDKGSRVAALDAAGMIAGAVAVTVACLTCFAVVRRIGAVRGSLVLWCVWGVVAEAAYFGIVR
jgi:hypothetical protein